MSKAVKQMELDTLTKAFQGVRDMVLLTSSKVGAQLDFNTRKTLREKKIRVVMVKNSLAKRVFEGNNIKLDEKVWSGTTLVAYGPESVKDLSKAIDTLLKDIVKKDPKSADKIKVKTAVADGQQVSFEMAQKIPTRHEAIGEIISMILGPASSIAGCLAAPGGQLASQIATIAEKKPEEAPATTA